MPPPTRTHTRRDVLRRVGTAAAAGTMASSSAGCLELLFGYGGSSPGANIPPRQAIFRDDADVIVSSRAALLDQLSHSDGRIVWIEPGVTIDLTGTNITLRNITIASGRSEGVDGAQIITSDRGVGSPVRDDALITLEAGARLTGVTVRGPLYNYTASNIVPGYVPFAPGGDWDIRERWRNGWYSRGISIQADEVRVDNCEIWGWSTAIMVGAKERAVSPQIAYCFIHNCMLESAGYCVDVKRGTPTIYRCGFDAYRHALNGFGYADAGYYAIECVFGPHKSGHDIDMHGIHNNARDGGSSDPSDLRYRWRAGGLMIVRRCTIHGTTEITDQHHNGVNAGTHAPSPYIHGGGGGTVPHVHIRAAPAEGFYFENNVCEFPSPLEAIRQTSVPGRFNLNSSGWYRIFESGNQWGVTQSQQQSAGASG